LRLKKWLAVIGLALVAVFMIAGIAVAAMTLNFNGSVTVVPSGGGGTPSPETYLFKVYDSQVLGTEITDAYWTLGEINVNSSVIRDVWVENTGTGQVTVTALISGLTVGEYTSSEISVTVPAESSRVRLPLTFTAGPTAAPVNNYSVTFAGNP
jgi:hypothetical protein